MQHPVNGAAENFLPKLVAGGLHLVCDSPAGGQALAPGDPITGWALSSDGVREVEIWLDGQLIGRTALDQERPDVAATYPDLPSALHSGFHFEFPTLAPPFPRDAELRLVAGDGAGRRAEVTRVVWAVPTTPIAGSLDIPKHHPPEDPSREAGWSSPLVVFGWAIDIDGIERIDVLLDEQLVGWANHGLPHEDTDLLRPDCRNLGLAAQSSWLAIIPTDVFNPGRHELSAVVHGRSGSLRLHTTPIGLRTESVRADSVRRQRMDAALRCPKCGQPFGRSGGELICYGCGGSVQSSTSGTLLLEETYAGLDWREAELTSHGYPPEAPAVIMDCQDGLVLDIGAGMRENLPNVIQLDAIPFPTTDVSANTATVDHGIRGGRRNWLVRSALLRSEPLQCTYVADPGDRRRANWLASLCRGDEAKN